MGWQNYLILVLCRLWVMQCGITRLSVRANIADLILLFSFPRCSFLGVEASQLSINPQ